MLSAQPPFVISAAYESRMPRQEEASSLVLIGSDFWGSPAYLVPCAATAWQAMQNHATSQGIALVLVSAFRSIAEQEALLNRFAARGMSEDELIRRVAMPGFSEHHTGLAIDIGSSGRADPVQDFTNTAEFSWLIENAHKFAFSMTYPENNRFEMAYEPWHWKFALEALGS
jgi:zinc D-Ala-D-Ala carboxypeptidase